MDTKEVIERCGGSARVAYILNLHQTTIDLWIKRGIPEKHWDHILDIANPKITVSQLHRANKKIRAC